MESAAPSSPSPQERARTDKPLNSISDVISGPLAHFDHQRAIIEPFDNEAKRDSEFQESEYMHCAARPRDLTVPLEHFVCQR